MKEMENLKQQLALCTRSSHNLEENSTTALIQSLKTLNKELADTERELRSP